MNRIDKTLAALNAQHKKMLSPYITAGDPNIETNIKVMHALVEGGADIIEVGIPFSDPMAEGIVIQGAMERALKQGVNTDTVFSMIHSFRQKDTKTPIVLMTYLNPIEQYGYEHFVHAAVEHGVDGLIVVDMPPEESEALAKHCDAKDLYIIYLCSSTTEAARFPLMNARARGYLYYVSLKGVTGAAINFNTIKDEYFACKQHTKLPLMIGFGIKNANMAASIAAFSDGVIVGAALIEKIYVCYEQQGDVAAAAFELMRDFRQAMDKKGVEHE